MDGNFKTDFSNDKFDRAKRFSRVLMQQGRVQLDADWNEQIDILLYYVRTLVIDLAGPFWGPGDGFKIAPPPGGDMSLFSVTQGHYYVDGILSENDADQPYYLPATSDTSSTASGTTSATKGSRRQRRSTKASTSAFLVYLDVWERQVTTLEDVSILEVALKGPDTTTRAKVMWQVRTWDKLPEGTPTTGTDVKPYVLKYWPQWLQQWFPPNRGYLKAGINQDNGVSRDPCITAPTSQYRGIENQLYRVEIHDGGSVSSGSRGGSTTGGPTFKWSRENGSVVLPISDLKGNIVTVKNLGRDDRFGLRKNDWVEIVDDSTVLDSPNPLLQVETVDYTNSQVILKTAPSSNIGDNPLLRRWDQHAGDSDDPHAITLNNDGVAILQEGAWLTLEDGVQIWFQSGASTTDTPTYRSGDYWLIPARTALGNIIWPQDDKGPVALPPHGVQHHYAPLAVIVPDANGNVTESSITDVRDIINKLTI
ncbi:MAG TPA: DUF6519 domain-containing protein [Ktedonobacteraceae bacterium]|nr:DUF6519 domain-containing protein [Ktedonobacteraceae bacterium]